nr:MurR/RpiR family transcriptional regulator [Dysosmobacter acutus]
MSVQKLLKQIQQSSQDLPQAQRAVAEYVLTHYMDIPFMSVTSLARAIGVSDTTIIKFCIQQGFDGYSSFKKMLADHVQSEVTMYNKLEQQLDTMTGNNTLEQVLACDIGNLEATLSNPINHENFDRFLDALDKANHIYVLGLRTASMQAEYLASSLRVQNRKVFTFPNNGHFVDQLCQVTPDDLFIAVTFSRYSTNTVKALQYLSTRKVPCAAITDSTTSPAYGLADISFICETKSFSYQGSYVACAALIDAIITASAKRRKEETTQHLHRLEDAFQEFNSFLSYDMHDGTL